MLGTITWAHTQYYGIVLIIFFAITGILLYRVRKTERAIYLLAGTWTSTLITHFSRVRLWCKTGLLATGLLLLCVAFLRPHGDPHEHKIAQQGRDVYFVLDVSRSMLAEDGAPDRLTSAKEKIKRTVSLLECDRAGLILFSGSAFVQCPLTTDRAAFLLFLNAVDVDTIASGTTALDGALMKSLDAFAHMPGKKNKLIVVLTDGEDFSRDLAQVKKRARDQGLHIFVIGVGSAKGAPIPLCDQTGKIIGHQRDDQGNIVITQLNEALLKTLVADVGGEYIQVTEDDSDVRALARRVCAFEKEELGDTIIKQYNEYYPYLVALSFICFALEWLL